MTKYNSRCFFIITIVVVVVVVVWNNITSALKLYHLCIVQAQAVQLDYQDVQEDTTRSSVWVTTERVRIISYPILIQRVSSFPCIFS